jgi:putative transcriptional regulator
VFNENLKNFRQQKGLTQEELAERLHVVRQTVSKWEKGLSVPDAGLLIRLAEVFETTVGILLGETVELTADKNIVAQKLEQLNALLAEKNRRNQRIWKTVSLTLVSIVLIMALFITIFVAVRVQVSQNYGKVSSVFVKESLAERVKTPGPATYRVFK